MILNGKTFEVIDDVTTKIMLAMVKRNSASGAPYWYDYGKDYDNITIDMKLSGTMADHESIVDNPPTAALEADFANGEWIYTGVFGVTVQSYKLENRADKASGVVVFSYVFALSPTYDVKTSTDEKLAYAGTGAITMGGVKIPQPSLYTYRYDFKTPRYAGITHGDSFALHRDNSPFVSVGFTSRMKRKEARMSIYGMMNSRGSLMSITFPEDSFQIGDGSQLTSTYKQNTDTIEIRLLGGTQDAEIVYNIARAN